MDFNFVTRQDSTRQVKGLNRSRPLSYDDLRILTRCESKKHSLMSQPAGKKKLFIDTCSTETQSFGANKLATARMSSAYLYNSSQGAYSTKNQSTAKLEATQIKSPKDVIQEKLKYFESLRGPSKKISPKEAVQEFFDLNGEKVYDLICISDLDKATKSVTRRGLDGLTLSYVRQLKQFCNEVMKHFERI